MFDDRALIFRSGLRKVFSKVAVPSKSMRRLPAGDDCRFMLGRKYIDFSQGDQSHHFLPAGVVSPKARHRFAVQSPLLSEPHHAASSG